MQKYKIVPRSSLPSEEVVNSLKNFDHILAKHHSSTVKKWWGKPGVGALFFLVVLVPVVFINLSDKAVPRERRASIETARKQPVPLEEGKISGSEISVPQAENIPKEKLPVSEEVSLASENPTNINPSQPPLKSEFSIRKGEPRAAEKVNTKTKESYFNEEPEATPAQLPVFTEAVPEAGYPVLYRYFTSNLKYPECAKANNSSGVVVVSFFIDQEGKAQDIQVEQSLEEGCDAEAMRLVRNMPRWKPAMAKETPVN